VSLGYEFAPIDVSIITHDKVLDIKRQHRLAAFGLWCWGQCYARTHRTDGLLRRSAVLASLAGTVADIQRLAAELVRVGLWVDHEAGWSIHNFEKKSARATSSAERMRRLREKRGKADGGDVTCDVTPVTVTPNTVTVCSSSSSSSSDLKISSPADQINLTGGSVGPPAKPPEWFADLVQAICDDTGERFGVPEAWMRYSGHRATKGIAVNPQDARYWLGTVMVPEARKERRAESDRRLNQQRRDGPPEKPKQSREEARREAQEFAAQLAARNKGAA